MADNYLERKMEDLHSGRLSNSTRTNNNTSKRILIIGGASGIGKDLTQTFVKAGCRVAVFDTNREEGENMAKGGSLRFTPIEAKDIMTLERAWQNLLKSWHDINTVIFTSPISEIYTLAQWWATRRTTHPSPSLHNSIMLLLYPVQRPTESQNNSLHKDNASSCTTSTVGQKEANTIISEKDIESILYSLYNILHPHQIEIRAMGYTDNTESLRQNCLSVAIPGINSNRTITYLGH